MLPPRSVGARSPSCTRSPPSQSAPPPRLCGLAHPPQTPAPAQASYRICISQIATGLSSITPTPLSNHPNLALTLLEPNFINIAETLGNWKPFDRPILHQSGHYKQSAPEN